MRLTDKRLFQLVLLFLGQYHLQRTASIMKYQLKKKRQIDGALVSPQI